MIADEQDPAVAETSAEDVELADTDPVVELVVTQIVDAEWYLLLDDPDAVDIAFDAGELLISIYTELHDMPSRDYVLRHLHRLVANNKTPVRFARLQAVFARLGAHPQQWAAA